MEKVGNDGKVGEDRKGGMSGVHGQVRTMPVDMRLQFGDGLLTLFNTCALSKNYFDPSSIVTHVQF